LTCRILSGGRCIELTDAQIRADMTWYFDQVLPQHPNGMIFSVYNADGDLLASNRYFS
jgi:hypothetical protein